MEMIFMSKANKPHKLVLNLSEGLDLRSPNKHITLKNLSLKKNQYITHGKIPRRNIRIINPK